MPVTFQRPKMNNGQKLRTSPAGRRWILFLIASFTLVSMILTAVIFCITKNPLFLASPVSLLSGLPLRKNWERIVNAYFPLNNEDYSIEKIKARGRAKKRKSVKAKVKPASSNKVKLPGP